MSQLRYRQSGVGGQEGALSGARRWLEPTLSFGRARTLAGFGHYAAVLELNADLALAICTDGVGTKTVVAAALDRLETIGFDCVAMNVNDIVCVGARPLALVDYLGVHTLDERRAASIFRGLADAATEAGIAIPGGEIAQLPDVIGSDGRALGDPTAFDLVGTCVGTLDRRDLILGDQVRPGDALVGLASSGIHSNGLTLARQALLESGTHRLHEYRAELGRTLGEELLEPTLIYVRPILQLWDSGIETHGLAHITGDGLTNLARLNTGVGYRIVDLFEPPAIFGLIQKAGDVSDGEMFRVFNMGVGFVAIVPSDQVDATLEVATAAGHRALRLGTVTDVPGELTIEPAGIALAAD